MEWDLVFYMEVWFRKVHVSPHNLSFCIYSVNIKVWKKAVLELFFVALFCKKIVCMKIFFFFT